MQAHDHVVKDLNEEFKKVDRAFGTNEVRVFGTLSPRRAKMKCADLERNR